MTLGDFIFALRDAKPRRFDAFIVGGLHDQELPDRFIVEKTKIMGEGDHWYVLDFDGGPPIAAFTCRAKNDVGKENPVIGTMKGSDA